MNTTACDPSAAYAVEVARMLWPDPWRAPAVGRVSDSCDDTHRDAYVFPSRRRPRLLVPADVPRAATMVRQLGHSRSRLTRPLLALVERAVRSPGRALMRWPVLRTTCVESDADSIEKYLGGCFDTDVRVGVMLGTRRVNQKPVLQVFDRDGRRLGFAKIGHNELTAALVRAEAASLSKVGGLSPRTFAVPDVLHHGRWRGLEVLVMSDLTTDGRTTVHPAARIEAMREVAQLTGTIPTPLRQSGFWSRLSQETARLSSEPNGSRLALAAEALAGSHGENLLTLGGWHGDWGAWNMGVGDGVLKVWDWERFDPEVPLGFDGLHHSAQSVRPGQAAETRQEDAFLGAVPKTLAELGVASETHHLTLCLYLLEIAVRYLDALTHGATPALTRRTAWSISLLERQLDSPPSTLVKGRS